MGTTAAVPNHTYVPPPGSLRGPQGSPPFPLPSSTRPLGRPRGRLHGARKQSSHSPWRQAHPPAPPPVADGVRRRHEGRRGTATRGGGPGEGDAGKVDAGWRARITEAAARPAVSPRRAPPCRAPPPTHSHPHRDPPGARPPPRARAHAPELLSPSTPPPTGHVPPIGTGRQREWPTARQCKWG